MIFMPAGVFGQLAIDVQEVERDERPREIDMMRVCPLIPSGPLDSGTVASNATAMSGQFVGRELLPHRELTAAICCGLVACSHVAKTSLARIPVAMPHSKSVARVAITVMQKIASCSRPIWATCFQTFGSQSL